MIINNFGYYTFKMLILHFLSPVSCRNAIHFFFFFGGGGLFSKLSHIAPVSIFTGNMYKTFGCKKAHTKNSVLKIVFSEVKPNVFPGNDPEDSK